MCNYRRWDSDLRARRRMSSSCTATGFTRAALRRTSRNLPCRSARQRRWLRWSQWYKSDDNRNTHLWSAVSGLGNRAFGVFNGYRLLRSRWMHWRDQRKPPSCQALAGLLPVRRAAPRRFELCDCPGIYNFWKSEWFCKGKVVKCRKTWAIDIFWIFLNIFFIQIGFYY